jgi:hypothetical protein
MSRTDQYIIHLTRERDKKDFGVWQSMTGVGVESAETSTRDGYGLPRKQLGAQANYDPMTCGRTFYPETDNGQLDELKAGAGKDRFIANKQKLSVDGHATGNPKVFNCMLKSCKEADANVGDDTPSADTYTVELSPDGPGL